MVTYFNRNYSSLNIIKANIYEKYEFEHEYVIKCSYTNICLFAMNGLRKKNVFLVERLVQLQEYDSSFSDLLVLDVMLIPINCITEEQCHDYNKFFDTSDFGLYLQYLRNQIYPHWNLFIFVDYYFNKYKFNWSCEMIHDLGKYLGELPLNGLVRSSFFNNFYESSQSTYIDISTGASIVSFNMFDTTQTFAQVLITGDTHSLQTNTPLEFKKEIVIYPLDPPSTIYGIGWDLQLFPTHHHMKWFSQIIITMVRLTDNDVEYRQRFNRYITSVSNEHFLINTPVVCIANDDDMIYFECTIPGITISKFIGYNIMNLPCIDLILCKIDTIITKLDHTTTIIRQYFAIKCIQRHWRTCISNPSYYLCKKRLLQDFEELNN